VAKKQPYQDAYYVELAGRDAYAPKPGAFFYAPILFDVNVVATVRPVEGAGGRPALRDGRMLFDVQLPLPEDAFKRPTSLPPNIKPHEELVAVAGKLRPVVILSPEEDNHDTALVVPSFKAANFRAEDLEVIRSGDALQYFYLPPCERLHVLESVLDFQKVQPVRMDPKLVCAGNRREGDPARHFLRLSDDYLAELREALADYLGLAQPKNGRR
jgi:hypothetical protein